MTTPDPSDYRPRKIPLPPHAADRKNQTERIPSSSKSSESDSRGTKEKTVEKKPFFTFRKKMILGGIGGGLLIVLYVASSSLLSRSNPESFPVQPVVTASPVPSETSDVSPLPSPSVPTAEGTPVSVEERSAFLAQYTVTGFIESFFYRNSEEGIDATLDSLKGYTTETAFLKASEEVKAWDWNQCAETDCKVSGSVAAMEIPSNAGTEETVYQVFVSLEGVSNGVPSLLPTKEYYVALLPVYDERQWVVSDYQEILQESGD